MAIAPVIVGTAAALGMGGLHWGRAVLAALVALLLQIGVNYANDYSDGIRGTDEDRVGPLRLVGSGVAKPHEVKMAAFGSLGLAMVAGLVLVILSQQWTLLLVGAGAVLAAWGYTGGKKPYGYLGLGDVFVFVFFGPVATLGTTFTQVGAVDTTAVVGSISTGLIAVALLMANNVRDIPTDAQVGKMTLAVRLGDRNARISYVVMLALSMALTLCLVPDNPWMLLMLLQAPFILLPSWIMLKGRTREALIPVLQQTGMLNLGFSLLFAAAVLLNTL
ncbi:1,4-dihydroxy-2-naphthoate octaprenyltransferase [Arthrobacter stackebrandtii]|uniref:1,4-dihydroxy-2-naphthoate octaprenyltransferase n=2 Tax=Arthrobacter stackebrandtii TaxID=272161 RepID=A0ABS4YWA1_9MICC|nr:1,4-dihydroxy-2-naphthoate octaprenyltransferase [Arthrobacter stackebrandtii]